MKLIHTTTFALLLGLFSGCSMLKTARLLKRGSVRQSIFKTEVPFEMRFGLIILKVNIHGKEYDFLLDTGAPGVISKELAQQLDSKAAVNRKAGDSQGNSASLEFTTIDSIGVGGVQFLNTGAAIADLRRSPEIACLNVEGLIGANLMRKAVWEVDYERRIITITNDRHSLSVPSNAKTVKFHTALSGTPLIDLQLNGHIDRNVTMDLGSNGDFTSSEETFKALKKKGLRTDIYSYGFGASGLYGKGKEDTTWYAVISSLQLDSVKLSNQVVSFSKKGAKLAGTNFFKNYRLIIDWSLGELTMISVKPYDNISEKMFSFSLVLRDHQVFIGSIHSTGDVAVEGPRFGDQVLEIDGKDYRSCSGENWCTVWLRLRSEDPAPNLLVKRGDKELNFRVTKEALFLKK